MKTKLNNWKSLAALIVGVACLAFAAPAFAQTDTSNLSVTASVGGSCNVLTPSALAFGTYDPIVTNLATDLPGQADFTVQCTTGTVGTIGMGNGGNHDGTDRRMIGATVATQFLTYRLFKEVGHTNQWTNAAPGTVDTTGDGTAKTLTVYGLVLAGQTGASRQNYSDTVVVTVTFTP